MARSFARFAATPIGPGLLAGDGGLTLTTSADDLNIQRAAVATVAHAEGAHGAEFTFWGDADLVAAIGVADEAASLDSMVGTSSVSVGWQLDAGLVYAGDSVVATGLPPVAKGDTVGVRVLLDSNQVELYKGGTLVHSRALPSGHAWRFAASLAAPEAATLWAAVNAGQWQAVGPAAAAGWRPAEPVVPTVRISDIDHLDADHQRWEGVIDASGISTVAALGFWAWGGGDPMQGAAAQLTINDVGTLDDLAQADVAGVPVAVRMGDIKADSGVPTFRQPTQPQITGVRRNLSNAAGNFGGMPDNNNAYRVKTDELAPDGWHVWRIAEKDTTAQHSLGIYADVSDLPQGTYTQSLFVRDAGRSTVVLSQSKFGHFSGWRWVAFDLGNGTVVGGNERGEIYPAGDGFWRISITADAASDLTGASIFNLKLSDGTVTQGPTYEGDGESGVDVWGSQLELGTEPTPYQAVRSPTDFDGSGLPVGSIWHQTDANDQVIGTYRYNGATWDPYEVPDTTVPVARFAADRLETLDDGRKVLHLRGAHDYLDEPANPGQFLPSIPALAWRTQPMVIGAVASVPYLGANSDGSVGWLADAPLAHVEVVLDRGDPMEPGTWSVSDDGQQVLLEQPPVGPVVVDASSIGPGMQPASLQEFLHELFSRARRGAWSEDDAAAIDAATGYAGVGFYAGDQMSFREVLAAVLPSYGAWWWEDASGVLRFSRVVDPETLAPAFEIEGGELASDLVLVPDAAPNLSRRMAYRPNARMLSAGELVTDLVDVPVWRRNELTAAWRGQVYSAQPLAGRYGHADTNPPLVSVFWSPQDAQAEIDRVCALYAQPRAFYQAELAGELDLAPHPGQVCRLTYDRYGLQAGRLLLVRAVERNPVTGQVALTLWG